MKLSRRNLQRARAAKEKLRGGPPKVSKYARKVRGQLEGPPAPVPNRQVEQAMTETPPYTSARVWKAHYK